MSLKEEIARIGLKAFAKNRFKFKVTYTDFHPKRKEPYFLIANHAQPNDPLFLGMFLKCYPYPVANALLYTKPMMRFGLTHIVTSIMKRKGQSDIQTIKQILKAFNQDKRGVMLFPEGNSSYYGNETPTDFTSTAKLLKKINKDVIMGQINGGFFAQPRWGRYVKKGAYHIHYYKLFGVEDLNQLSIDDLSKKMTEAMKFNDYAWNKKMQIPYKSKHKAEGLSYYLYACPVCQEHKEIKTVGNDIYCPDCGHIGHINLYNFIEKSPFETLIDWGKFQKDLIPTIIKEPIESTGDFYDINFDALKRTLLGHVTLTLTKDALKVQNDDFIHVFEMDLITGFALTQKNFISFDYEQKTYDIEVAHPMLIVDAIQYIKGASI